MFVHSSARGVEEDRGGHGSDIDMEPSLILHVKRHPVRPRASKRP